MKNILVTISAVLCLLLSFSEAWGCDPCALYNASRIEGHIKDTFTFSLSEQFTTFDKAEDIPENSVREGEYVRGYSVTHLSGAYDFNESFGLQITLPIIGRRFDKIEKYRTKTDSDSGIGDVSLLGTYSFVNYKKSDWSILGGVSGGIKLPTGDTGVIEDVSNEELELDLEQKVFTKHQGIGTTSGGKTLTFGTGSYDYIFGVNLISRFQRYFMFLDAQYTLRTEGDFNYEFADDFIISAGPGYYFNLQDNYTLAGRLAITQESKAKDHLNGKLVEGSELSNLYIGPELIFTSDSSIAGILGVDFRVNDQDRGAEVVPEARIKATISYRFS